MGEEGATKGGRGEFPQSAVGYLPSAVRYHISDPQTAGQPPDPGCPGQDSGPGSRKSNITLASVRDSSPFLARGLQRLEDARRSGCSHLSLRTKNTGLTPSCVHLELSYLGALGESAPLASGSRESGVGSRESGVGSRESGVGQNRSTPHPSIPHLSKYCKSVPNVSFMKCTAT